MVFVDAYVPADSSHEVRMADALAEAGRHFVKPLRYDGTDAVFPDFVLIDTDPVTYVEVWGITGRETYEHRKQAKREIYQQSESPLLEWDVAGHPSSLIRDGHLTSSQPGGDRRERNRTVRVAGHTEVMGVHPDGARAFLDVPFVEKDQAKALGARWDPSARRWYAPPRSNQGLQRWAPQPEIPELLPGEDRRFGSGLFVDLVPASCWFTNVRSCIAQKDWERLRRMMRTRAGDRCEICGRGEDRELRRWLEAHERWHYDDHAGVQTLRRLILCCSWCHQVTHIGLAEVQGHGETARAHLRAVTGMTPAQAQDHIDTAFALWHTRSARTWGLDLNILTEAGVTLVVPPDHRDRADFAYQQVSHHRRHEGPGAGGSASTTPAPGRSPDTTTSDMAGPTPPPADGGAGPAPCTDHGGDASEARLSDHTADPASDPAGGP